MARSLRIQYYGAWYHVMNRGAGKQKIFLCEKHYKLFITLLEEIHNRYQIEIHAYCLMPNHYHLLIKTNLPNLSRAMQHLDGVYTQRYNKIQKTDGPLLRGRYKSIIVDASNYLLRLSRYIHLNPVTSNITRKPEDYLWSSYNSYIKPNTCQYWLTIQTTLEQLGEKGQKLKYELFIKEGIDGEINSFFNQVKLLPILGSEVFKKNISEKYLLDKKLLPEISEHKLLEKRIDSDFIINFVSSYYKVATSELLISRRSIGNKPRTIAIYLVCKISGEALNVIAQKFLLKNYSAVSQSYYRLYKKIKANKKLAKEVNSLEQMLLQQFSLSNVKI